MRRDSAQMSERFRLGALLALAGGFLDAYTYLTRGGVFANAQTGNMVLLGINLLEGQWARAGSYLVPILAFAAGVLAAEWVRRRCQHRAGLHWRQRMVAAEIVILAGVALLPHSYSWVANVLVSFTCALQVESFRKLRGRAFATTMCTGNLRSGTELLFRALTTGEREEASGCLRYYGVILFFIAGAVLGGVACARWGEYAVLCCCVLLLIAFIMMFRGEKGLAESETAL